MHTGLFHILLLLQQQKDGIEGIKEKLDKAPDTAYQTGVIIGTYLPLILLVGLAYFLYFKAKKRKEK
jgi:hypothetical protein